MMGLGRLYVVEFHNVNVVAQQDMFYIKPAADKMCFIEEIKISNVGIGTDAGDAQEELLDVEVIHLGTTVTVGSGGTAFTPIPMAINDAVAGFTSRINDTTKATSSGTTNNRDADGWNVRIPFLYLPAPEHRYIVANPSALTFRLNSTPTDGIITNGRMLVREIP
jgi:hypothetical protein